MKRWMILVGRVGTVLVTISLALFLVSLVPPSQTRVGEGRTEVPSRTFSALNDAPPFFPLKSYYSRLLTPQDGVELELSANGTITAYILEVDFLDIYYWISEQQQSSYEDFNVTRLEEFLAAFPESINWQQEINTQKIQHKYIPTKVTNITIVYSNPSSENIGVTHSYREISFIAPSNKVQTIAYWTTPIGIVLTIPWLVEIWKGRKQK